MPVSNITKDAAIKFPKLMLVAKNVSTSAFEAQTTGEVALLHYVIVKYIPYCSGDPFYPDICTPYFYIQINVASPRLSYLVSSS
jgi:hypothetical protein